MRILSSIVATIVLASLLLAFQIWREVDPHFNSRDQMVGTLAIVFVLTGVITAFTAIVLALKRRPVAVGFGVYAMLHGSGWLYCTWRWNTLGGRPGLFDILACLAICAGLRAVMMLRKCHHNAAPH